jgi:RNA polymerase sigma factor (sigma-70 family)
MPGQPSTILRQIDLAFNVGTVVGLTDAELVERFVARPGPVAEAAFAALVRRHGPMVHRVCRSIVRDHHDAQDAAQATFLILARKAGSLRVGTSLGPWLHGVACRVASNARAAAARRRTHESRAAGMTPTLVSDQGRDDVGPIVHEEIARMPDRYRDPVVLCDLEGRTYQEAAHLLGRPVGTIKSRLARGREHLRGRIIRRGVAPAALASAGLLSARSARSAAWTASIEATSRIAAQLAAGRAASDLMPSAVLALMEGALKMMYLSRLKLAAAILLIGCGASSVPVICGQSSRGEAGPLASQAMRPTTSGESPETKPNTPAPATAPRTPPPLPIDPSVPSATPWQAVVRIKVRGPHSTGFGSGTIIHSTAEESLILTCGHIFKPEEPASDVPQFPRPITVDLFDGRPTQASWPPRVSYVESFAGEAIDFDFTRDVGLIRIRPGRRLPASKIVPSRWEPRVGMQMLTIGCSEGQDATAWGTRIVNPRMKGFLQGQPDYEAIECESAPRQGRTGGGLFTADGYLAGVCNFAEPRGDHGLYATPASIYRLLDRNNLAFLHAEHPAPGPTAAGPNLDELIRTAEGQLQEGDLEGVDRTLQRLNGLIERRRKALQDELRSLDTTYARRRDKLVREASERRPEPPREAAPRDGIPVPGVDLVPDRPVSPQAGARLDRILDVWRRRSADHTSLDVRFSLCERDRRWGDDVFGTGRIVLAPGGRMLVELDRGTGAARDRERIIWTDDAWHQFLSKSKTHFVRPIAAEDRGRLPVVLALPFCWRMNAEDLKSRFRVELVSDDRPGTCLLRFTPLTPIGRETFSTAYVELDRSTYLPCRYVLILPGGKVTKDYRVTEARWDRPVPEETWRIPDDRGWTVNRLEAGQAVERWLSRLIKLDLVP